MSSWLSISLPNPFKPSQSDDHNPSSSPESPNQFSDDHTPSHFPAGVKDDLSLIGQTIGRQLRGVAAFLAPPPPAHSASGADSYATTSETLPSSKTILGIKNDLDEIGGSFKSGLSLFSTSKAVTKFSSFASNLLQFQDEGSVVDEDEDEDEDEDGEVAGITDEVLDFVQEISSRPECWTDFPSSVDNEFVMTDSQKTHASTVEDLVPNLMSLRHKLHSSLSDEQFWMIYFILLLPRLNENDYAVLSTPEVVDAREVLLQKLKNKNKASAAAAGTSVDAETVKFSQESGRANNTLENNNPVREKEVSTEPVIATQCSENDDDDDENSEEWLDNPADVTTCPSEDSKKHNETEDDVSFSDLEDDDNVLSGKPSVSMASRNYTISPSVSNDWIQLRKAGQSTSQGKDSEGEESNEWLKVDDLDLDSSSC